MSNAPEKIPEKKLPTVDDMVGIYNLPMTGDQYIRQQRGDAIPDVAELQRQNAVLKTLFRKLFDEASWTVYDTIQNEACEAGAIIPHEVTQEDIDDVRFDSSECELGDTVFMMSDWMTDDAAKISIPSRAQVAREFMESVFRSHANANYKLPLAETMGIVLKEWEEADAKQAKPRQ